MVNINAEKIRRTDRRGTARKHQAALTADDAERGDDYVDVLAEIFYEKYGYPQESAKEEVKRVFREFV